MALFFPYTTPSLPGVPSLMLPSYTLSSLEPSDVRSPSELPGPWSHTQPLLLALRPLVPHAALPLGSQPPNPTLSPGTL